MTIEVILLALASTVRPTSLAAVYALVSSESPRRLVLVYITAGLTFTIAFGLLVIWAFNGVAIHSGRDETKGIAEIIGGIVALTFAVLILTGHVGGPHADDAPDAPGRWKTLLERRLSADTAALAGPATHIPGLFYLIALNVIAAHQPSVPTGLVEVLIYNTVWFALPIGALAICVIDPLAARRAVDQIRMWTRSHTHALLLTVSLVAGAGLVIRGVMTI
jgi:Sap, sulfolipid-1-addressing protein